MFSYFPLKTSFNISCKLSGDNWHEISNSVFLKSKKNFINLSSAELVQSVVKVKETNCIAHIKGVTMSAILRIIRY